MKLIAGLLNALIILSVMEKSHCYGAIVRNKVSSSPENTSPLIIYNFANHLKKYANDKSYEKLFFPDEKKKNKPAPKPKPEPLPLPDPKPKPKPAPPPVPKPKPVKKLSPIEKFRERKKAKLGQFSGDKDEVLTDWKTRHQETLKKWRREKRRYLDKIKLYKNALIEIEAQEIEDLSPEIKSTPFSPKKQKPFKVVESSLEIPIRDQFGRGTCAAFSSIRAIETLSWQNDQKHNLSEQYFYWASKPSCQRSPCSKEGSWSLKGLKYSKRQSKLNIPLESYCAYSKRPIKNNSTHIPLENACLQKGKVRVNSYELADDYSQIISLLDKNIPLISAFKLTPNFFSEKTGVILNKESQKGESMSSMHASGHAVLIVGYMALPKSLWASEGENCLIIANSWGMGWGSGGYGCISHKWFSANRYKIPFIGVSSLEI